MHEDKIVKAIFHYQQNLERYIDKRNEGKMIYCMEKLQQLPITVSHLEHTGVGRTVNSVRKMKGIKGPKNTAKQLVSQWKKMVTEEEQNESEDADSNQDDEDEDDDADDDRLHIYSENEDNLKEGNEDEEQTRNIEMHHSSHYEEPDGEKYKKFRDRYSEHKYCDNDWEETRETRIVKHTSPNCTYDEDYADYYGNSSQGSHDDAEEHENCDNQSHDIGQNLEPISSKAENLDVMEDSDEKNKIVEDRHYKERSKSKRHKSVDRTDNKSKERHNSKDHRESEKDKEIENHKENGHHKSSTSDKKSKHSKHRSSKSSGCSSSHKESHKHKDKEKEVKESSANSNSNSKQKDQSRRDKEKEKVKVEPPASSSEKKTPSSSSSKKRPQEDTTKALPSKKVKLSFDDGIDGESGASFGEALGFMMMPSTSKARKDKRDSPKSKDKDKDREKDKEQKYKHKEHKSHKDRDTNKERHRDRDRSEKNNDKKDNKMATGVHTALKMPPSGLKLIPLEDFGITNLLPQISTNYKPVGHLPGEGFPRTTYRHLDDDEMLSKLMYSKNQRTKVYSGNKVIFGKIPSLFDLCIRILQDHIDNLALGFTGGVPYSILKPVLERATPVQLFSLEHHNAYLMEESDELWLSHCQREFKTKKRNEMETWREMYLRCTDERDEKLKSLTANIKLAQVQSVPVRQTKLAYVDSIVKPPRNIAKKQAKNGLIVSGKPAVTPSSRLNQLALAGGADKICVPNPGSHRVNSSGGSSGSGGNNYTAKPKKAPLMAKTLQLMKGRFRR